MLPPRVTRAAQLLTRTKVNRMMIKVRVTQAPRPRSKVNRLLVMLSLGVRALDLRVRG